MFLVWPGGAFGQNASPESPSPVRKVDLYLSGHLFREYKYFGTKYSWDSEGSGDSNVKLDFRTHIISGGLGWSF